MHGRGRRGVEAGQLQLPVLPRRPAVDPEVADRGGGDRRRGPGASASSRSSSRCCRRRRSSCSSSTSSTRSSTRSASSTPRPAAARRKATEILVYKVYADGFKGLDLGGSAAQSVILMAIVIALTVDPVPLRRAQGAVLSDSTMIENRPLADVRLAPGPADRRGDRRAAGLRDVRRVDARAGRGAAGADAAAPGHAPDRELHRRCSRRALRQRHQRRRSAG